MTEPGAQAAFDAIAKGASDYVFKPNARREALAPTMQRLAEKIVALVKTRRQLASIYGPKDPSPQSIPAPSTGCDAPEETSVTPRRRARPRPYRPQLVLIGTSTGGPQALGTLLPALAHPLPVPILVVQHMPPMFTRQMAARLDKLCPVPVREAKHG